jgi:hypothetical protein
LLPQATRTRRENARRHRHLAVTAALFVMSLMMVYGALRVASARLAAQERALQPQIGAIRADGEEIGQRLRQIEALRAVRQTRNDLRDVIAGLYAVTPPGVTYSQVELDEHGGLRLRGQAENAALPFELPERLEKYPAFEAVILQDAGQAKRDAGSITEFRIDARLRRGPTE